MLKLKDACGLTFKQIAEECNTSDANARRYITGETKEPDPDLLRDIILCMGGDPDDVLSEPAPQKSYDTDLALAQKSITVLEERLLRQDLRHEGEMQRAEDRHQAEIANLRSAYETSSAAKDGWINLVRSERDEAQGKISKLEDERRKLLVVIVVLAFLLCFMVAIYFVPDLLQGDWGHIRY